MSRIRILKASAYLLASMHSPIGAAQLYSLYLRMGVNELAAGFAALMLGLVGFAGCAIAAVGELGGWNRDPR